jgi:uncharacterized protein (DUF4415 family)
MSEKRTGGPTRKQKGAAKKKGRTVRLSADDLRKRPSKTDWERVDALSDEEIERAAAADPDAVPVMSEEEWLSHARWAMPAAGGKAAVSIRLDRNVLEWFRAQGPRYQSRINAVLRAYVRARESAR